VIAKGWFNGLEINAFLQTLSCLEKEIPIDSGECEQARSGIECISGPPVGMKFPAHSICLFHDCDRVAFN
jgi:hypothetical protein